MRTISLAFLMTAALFAQSANPIVATSQSFYAQIKDDVLRSAQKVPEDLWSFRPAPEVRTFGQLVGHIADGHYEICGALAPGKPINKDIEKSVKGKEATIAALKDAFSYCDGFYATMTDLEAGQLVDFFGRRAAKIGVLDFNTQHTNLHYGNMVTYMRIKGIVPASSEPGK